MIVALALQAESPRASLDRWLAALNSHDPVQMRPFRGGNVDAANEDWDLARHAGSFKFVRSLSEGFLVRLERTNEFRVFTVGQTFGMRPPSRDEILPEVPKATSETLAKRIQAHLDYLVRNDRLSGSFAVVKEGKAMAKAHGGFAHIGYRVPNRFDTKFNLASMGKMFTAVMVARRIESGVWTLDSNVGDIWPAFENAAIKEKVTLRHLLSHRSGMADMFTDEFFAGSKDRWKTVDEILPLFAAKPLGFEPGSQTAYSNAGFVLLGKLLEVQSGMDYWSLAQKEIFDPLGLKNTGPFEMDRDTPNLAFGYTHTDGDGSPLLSGPKNNLFMHIAKGSPAGGAFSSAPDMLKFAEALRAGRLLKIRTLATMTTPTGSLGGPGKYGLGLQLWEVPGEQVFGHTGGFPGIAGMMQIYPKSGFTLVAFSNRDSEAMSAASRVRMLITDTLR